MFYRFTRSGARIAVDLDGLYADQTIFFLGGSPALADMPLELLRRPGVVTIAVNNVPCVFPSPSLWLCTDKPPCFSPHIYASPEITKFTSISRRNEIVGETGKKVRDFPSMFFFGLSTDFNEQNILRPHRDLVWWKSVFPMALQLCWRLGFRRVFLAGCGFHSSGKVQYAWKTDLTDYQHRYSQRTYDRDLQSLRRMKPVFDRHGFQVISATPGSRANEFLDYTSLEDAVDQVTESLPPQADTTTLVHSSALTPPKR